MKQKNVLILTAITLIIGLSGYLFWSGLTTSDQKVYAEDQANTNNPTQAETTPENNTTGILPGLFAPDFTLENLSGEQVSLSNYQGKYVLLNFWAIWCPPCKAEMPDFNRFYQENKDQIVILGVELGSKKQDVQKFIQNGQYVYPVLLDLDKEIGELYRITAVPTTFILNPQGQIIHVIKGALNYEILEQIRQILLG